MHFTRWLGKLERRRSWCEMIRGFFRPQVMELRDSERLGVPLYIRTSNWESEAPLPVKWWWVGC